MSDQLAPPNGDTPAVAGPEQAPGTAQEQPQTDWEKRYQDLQPEYTRTTQQLRQLEQEKQYYEQALTAEDADTRRQALEALGYEIPEEEDPEPADYEDPYDELLARQERVEQQLSQREQQELEQQQAGLIRELTDAQFEQMDGLSEKDQDMILAYAINALPPVRQPGVPVPLPDIQGAHAAFQEWETERQKQWAKTKRAPYVPPGGVPANEVPNLDTHEGRVAQAMRLMHERESAE